MSLDLDVKKISSLQPDKRMGHNIENFHLAQLSEPEYMKMIENTASTLLNKISQENVNILEIGSGTGILTTTTIENLITQDKSFTLNISEPDEELLKYAQRSILNKNYALKQNQNIHFTQACAEHTHLLQEKYDFIVSSETFHHIPYENKLTTTKTLLNQLKKHGSLIIGDNFVANKYEYKKNNELISNKQILAPQVASTLKKFWERLFNHNLPESFKKALEQQREGIIECKTSLPHLISILSRAGSTITINSANKDINENGGYAVITASREAIINPFFLNYINQYNLKQSTGGLQYDPLNSVYGGKK